MSIVKYRLKEVAADFGMAPKDIAEVVAKFSEKPKSNSQVLTDVELNAVFDYLTQKNQISSLEQVFAAKSAPKAEPVPAAPAVSGGGKKWVCTVCGYIAEGENPPAECPVCHVPASKFKELSGEK